MPIRAEFRPLYNCPEWEQARALVLERAGDRCERCGKPNHTWALVTRDRTGRWCSNLVKLANGAMYIRAALLSWRAKKAKLTGDWRMPHADPVHIGEGAGPMAAAPPETSMLFQVRTVLTVAHVNHMPADRDPAHLRAWCAWCHLSYDREHHRDTRITRKMRGTLLENVGAIAL